MATSVILVVEDEPAIADTICMALKLDGFAPLAVGTAGEALGVLAQPHNIALAIVDIGLPDQSGFDLLREIRKTSSLPVVLLTARSEEIDRVLGLELGADDYVVKPFSPRELVARLRAILRRTTLTQAVPVDDASSDALANHQGHTQAGGQARDYQGAQAEVDTRSEKTTNGVHTIGPFQVDTLRRIILYAGQRLPLSAYEYGTLELFLRHPGQVFSREQIMDHVWSDPEESFDRAVDTVIKNIRAAIRSAQQSDAVLDPIETRRGMGYCLREEIARLTGTAQRSEA